MENKTLNSSKLHQNIDSIKEKLIDYLYWLFFITMWFIIIVSGIRAVQINNPLNIYIQLSIAIFFIISFVFRSKFSYKVRSILLLLTIFFLSQSGLISFGIYSQGIILLLLLVVFSAVLFNKRFTLLIYALTVGFVILDYFFYTSNSFSFQQTNHSEEHSFIFWLMAIGAYSVVAFLLVSIWNKLTGFLMDNLATKINHEDNLNTSNEKLKQEIESRKETEAILIEQIADFEKLNKEINETNITLENANTLLTEAKKQAEDANNLKALFLSNISHEIRTPLNAILGFSTMLTNEGLTTDDTKKYTNIIQSSSNTLMNMISDIVTMSKIESNQFAIYHEPLNLDELIDDVSNVYTGEVFIKKETSVSFNIEKEFYNNTKNIITDRECFKQIIGKLLDNAIKFTESGSIDVKFVTDDNNNLEIIVKDTGIGIEKEKAQIIFDNFNQVDLKNNRKYGGLGIGLSIVRGLTRLLNGKVDFVSTLQKGSEFKVTIPFLIQENKASIPTESELSNWKAKTILIVGKGVRDNQVVHQLLQKANCFLLYVETGFQAIESCQQHPEINLIIIDSELPDMQSNQVAKMILKYICTPMLVHSDLEKLPENNEYKYWNGLINHQINEKTLIEILNLHLNIVTKQ